MNAKDEGQQWVCEEVPDEYAQGQPVAYTVSPYGVGTPAFWAFTYEGGQELAAYLNALQQQVTELEMMKNLWEDGGREEYLLLRGKAELADIARNRIRHGATADWSGWAFRYDVLTSPSTIAQEEQR